jgi:putative membrane protein
MGKIHLLLTKKFVLPSLLILVSIVLISIEKRKSVSLFVFLLSGFLGISVLNLNLNEPLLPLLTGLFGASTLILSIKNKTKVPEQEIKKPSEDISKPLAGAFLGSLIASPFSSFLPGLGSGQAAIIGNLISKTDRRGFLVLLGATNTLVMGFSFITFYTISKTRTGAAVAIQEIFGNISGQILFLILFTILVSGILAFYMTINLAKFFSKKIPHLNYSKLSFSTIFILATVIFLASGFSGLFVLAISTLTGIYCIELKVRRTNMMGVLLLPTILFYLI